MPSEQCQSAVMTVGLFIRDTSAERMLDFAWGWVPATHKTRSGPCPWVCQSLAGNTEIKGSTKKQDDIKLQQSQEEMLPGGPGRWPAPPGREGARGSGRVC